MYVIVQLSKVEGKTVLTKLLPFEPVNSFPRKKDTVFYEIVEISSEIADANESDRTQREGRQSDPDIESNTILETQDNVSNETVSNVSVEVLDVTEEPMSMELDDTALEETSFSSTNNFVSSLLAEGDPNLVKVLLDNSKPENLEVFLQNSNITVEELQDFVHF